MVAVRVSGPSLVGKRILVIPDTQVKPGVPIEHFRWIALWANEHPPDAIVHLGDHYDMPSLSAYDRPGSHAAEGRRVTADLDAGHRALELFAKHLYDETCPKYVTLGNHEDRVERAAREDATLVGLFGPDMFKFKEFSWTVCDYQKIVRVHAVYFSHFFDVGPDGHPTGRGAGQPNAKQQLARVAGSSVAGHRQGYSVHSVPRHGPIPGRTAVIAGSCYSHAEEYRGPNGNGEYRGAVMLNDVRNGDFQPMQVSLDYLKRTYGRFKS